MQTNPPNPVAPKTNQAVAQQGSSLTPAQKRMGDLRSLLEANKAALEGALPKHITPDRMLRIALTELRKVPALLDCTPQSFLGAIIQSAQLGLEPGGALGHSYLVPFKNKKTGVSEVSFIVGYRGMIDLAGRSDRVSHAIARMVLEGDQFHYEYGLNEKLEHKPSPKPNARPTHYYAILRLTNGRALFDVMTVTEIEEVRSRSKAPNYGPWATDYDAMAKKTVIRRLFKFMPVSIEIQRAVGLDELADTDQGQENSALLVNVPVEATGSRAAQLNRQVLSEATAKITQHPIAPEPDPVFDAEAIPSTLNHQEEPGSNG